MIDNANLDCLFNPRSVAVVGVSTDETATNVGRNYVEALLNCGFKGQIYPINPKCGEIQGLKIYASVEDIPGSVDYVVSCIPAPAVPQLITDCVAKGVKAVQFFTSGFSESGTEEGKRLESDICNLASRGNIRLIGPNCMGLYCPRAGLSFGPDFPGESGSLAFLCQSGGNAIHFTRFAAQRGARFSKVISYGNACDINESDLLEYLATDPETEVIAAYVEGVKDGNRFCRVLKETAETKPVILLKGGYTEAGSRAVTSHTGALAGSSEVWDGLLKQAGAIRVYSLDELVDMAATLLCFPLPGGRRLAIVGMGGGAAVMATDDCIAAGLSLPPLPLNIQEEIKGFFTSDAGTLVTNPVDVSGQIYEQGLHSTLETLGKYKGIDFILVYVAMGIFIRSNLPEDRLVVLSTVIDAVLEARKKVEKPIALVFYGLISNLEREMALVYQEKCYEAGVPVYHSISGAARAVDRFISYHERRGGR